VTQGGVDGNPQYGTIFVLDGNGKLRTLHAFTGGRDGATPTGGLTLDDSGNLYGTTQFGGDPSSPYRGNGCGVVFKLAP
jgi:uncharacterized repeat protein (TIGR03803 family)